MNWISNYVRPKINSLFSRREVPENLWTKCPECGTMLFHRELSGNLNVCTNCNHHMAIGARERLVLAQERVPLTLAGQLAQPFFADDVGDGLIAVPTTFF